MRRSFCTFLLLAMISTALAACKTGGPSGSTAGHDEIDARTFELISHSPDIDWEIRIRDSSMWVAYSAGNNDTPLGTVRLDAKETAKLWRMIDDLDLGGRDAGEPDEDAGYRKLRLREPTELPGEYDVISVYVTRNSDDATIVELGTYLEGLIRKYHKKAVEL